MGREEEGVGRKESIIVVSLPLARNLRHLIKTRAQHNSDYTYGHVQYIVHTQ